MKDLRDAIALLEERGELERIREPIDVRLMARRFHTSDRAVLVEHPVGYEMPAVGNLFNARRLAAFLGVAEHELPAVMGSAQQKQIQPRIVEDGPVRENVITDPDKVDLTRLPIPLLYANDGAPYLSASVLVTEEQGRSRNAGVYRLMLRTRRETGIDMVSNSDTALRYQARLDRGESLPIAIVLGMHPLDFVGVSAPAPDGVDEFAIAGGLKREAVPLVKCATVDIHVPAYAEIVLEGEILPTGWTEPEGKFGEFHRVQGPLHHNPLVRFNAMMFRNGPILHVMTQPDETNSIYRPIGEAYVRHVLTVAGVPPLKVNITPGGHGMHVVFSMRKRRPGDGKNALMVALALGIFKHAVVVDADVDPFDPAQVEWAIATRVQADKDLIAISGARAKPLDPSIMNPTPSAVTARWGLDATIPDGGRPDDFALMQVAFLDQSPGERVGATGATRSRDLMASGDAPAPADALRSRVEDALRGRYRYFRELLDETADVPYRAVVEAFVRLNEAGRLRRDVDGRYELTT
jgi:2,5-furandicarboxylate decarboxylase 1